MARRRTSIDDKLAALDGLSLRLDADSRRQALASALGEPQARLVAKAAALAAEQLVYELVPVLLETYARFLREEDPHCVAKNAIVHALVALDCHDVDFYLAGLRYRQPEPVWGGSVDTAVGVRSGCAMGLVGTGHARALHELTFLLTDPEARAREGAVRAIACGNPREAELLLRFKLLIGDREPEVLGECFTGLLAVAPEESLPLIAEYLKDDDEAVRQYAALALGESRLPEALTALQRAWDDPLAPAALCRALVEAAGLHRSDAAIDWLLGIAAGAPLALAATALESLAIYRHQPQLTERVREVLARRGEQQLQAVFQRLWA